MKHEATLRQIVMQPPLKLLSVALGREVRIRRSLSTDLIKVDDLHPDLLFEADDESLLHVELQGYPQEDFPGRNLLYRALIRRDHRRDPYQLVIWYGRHRVGIEPGYSSPPQLDYRYQVIDVRDLDAELFLDGEPGDALFAILCRMRDVRGTIKRILRRVMELPVEKRREAVTQVLILSGLRELEPLVRKEIRRMPLVVDIHENTFLHGIFEEGIEQGMEKGIEKGIEKGRDDEARTVLLDLLGEKFGPIPEAMQQQVAAADLNLLRLWSRRVIRAGSIGEIFR